MYQSVSFSLECPKRRNHEISLVYPDWMKVIDGELYRTPYVVSSHWGLGPTSKNEYCVFFSSLPSGFPTCDGYDGLRSERRPSDRLSVVSVISKEVRNRNFGCTTHTFACSARWEGFFLEFEFAKLLSLVLFSAGIFRGLRLFDRSYS